MDKLAPADQPRVLIIDDSRPVRAAIVRNISGYYDFREEADGEAGWQSLVLDHTIRVVISALSLPVLDGFGLLNRIRSSKLARIHEMPVIVVSGDEGENARERAKALGATDFITKGIGAAELLARLDSAMKLAAAQQRIERARDYQVQDPESGLFTRKYVELQTAQALSHAMRHNSQVSVMVMGFDRAAALREEYGAELVKLLLLRFSRLLAGKVRKEDSLGHYSEGVFAVVSPGAPASAAQAFANRLREAIAVANVSSHGQRLPLSVCVGVANSPADTVASAGALLDLAAARMNLAMQAGGNRVVGGSAGKPVEPAVLTLAQALDLIKAGNAAALLPQLAPLGRELLPLLRLLDKELQLALPLAEMEKRLLDRSREGKDERRK